MPQRLEKSSKPIVAQYMRENYYRFIDHKKEILNTTALAEDATRYFGLFNWDDAIPAWIEKLAADIAEKYFTANT